MEAGQPPPGAGGPPPGGPPPGAEAPQSEEELRARLEEEMRRVRVQDLVLQSAASLVNLTARRIAKEDERDLEQARIGIEAVRGLVGLLDPEPQAQVREALSELQLLYAQASGGGPEGGAPAEGDAAGASEPGAPGGAERTAPPQQPQQQPSQGTGQAPPRLWTPHQRD
ncbi:MAG TPA: hypothetical protein VFY99_09115 [Solirubrobacterales bacterium]